MMMEGCRLVAYRDAAGVPTIGYGHTKGVRMGDRISEYWAKELLKQDIAYFESEVRKLGVVRTEGQTEALNAAPRYPRRRLSQSDPQGVQTLGVCRGKETQRVGNPPRMGGRAFFRVKKLNEK